MSDAERAISNLTYAIRWNDRPTNKSMEMAIKALRMSEWIPVSERYPTDANKSYLVCYEDGCITIEYLYFDGNGYPFFSEMELGVVAWMPLLEPFESNTK